jgi:hypothetical protein
METSNLRPDAPKVISRGFARHLQRSVFDLQRSASDLEGLNLTFGGLKLIDAERNLQIHGAIPLEIAFRAFRSWVRAHYSPRFWDRGSIISHLSSLISPLSSLILISHLSFSSPTLIKSITTRLLPSRVFARARSCC